MGKETKALVALLIVLNLSFFFVIIQKENEVNTDYLEKVEQLTIENKLLVEEINQIDLKVESMDEVVEQFEEELINATKNINQKKEVRDEKMDRVNSMDGNDLYRFFTTFKTDSLND